MRRLFNDMHDISLDVPAAYALLDQLATRMHAEGMMSDALMKDLPSRYFIRTHGATDLFLNLLCKLAFFVIFSELTRVTNFVSNLIANRRVISSKVAPWQSFCLLDRMPACVMLSDLPCQLEICCPTYSCAI